MAMRAWLIALLFLSTYMDHKSLLGAIVLGIWFLIAIVESGEWLVKRRHKC